MSEVFETKARKVSADQVEVLDQNGSHIAGKSESESSPFSAGGFKVVKMGPLASLGGLLLLPVLIPVAIIGFFLLMIFAMIFGRAVLKTGMMKVMKR